MNDKLEQFKRLLDEQGNFYTVEDVLDHIREGKMQSFSDGESWAVTQVHDFPRKRVVDIAFVIGDIDVLSGEIQDKIDEFARSIGASMIIGAGRPGWDRVKSAGWKKYSVNYVRRL